MVESVRVRYPDGEQHTGATVVYIEPADGRCDICGREGPRKRWRVIQVLEKEQSRSVLLCGRCECPLSEIITNVAPKTTVKATITVSPVSALKPSPTLTAQARRKRKPKT